eukprot:TRINITY_DN3804_c0_g1_i2.p1 TRINITY_DN3804_c0_g1~~TRINITY_DN3804_c0_g1_i2.p1  ORF type:complete len:2107 (+),score=386.69 TRINITY_DN3804_c0_g1_i2:151-6471(+)
MDEDAQESGEPERKRRKLEEKADLGESSLPNGRTALSSTEIPPNPSHTSAKDAPNGSAKKKKYLIPRELQQLRDNFDGAHWVGSPADQLKSRSFYSNNSSSRNYAIEPVRYVENIQGESSTSLAAPITNSTELESQHNANFDNSQDLDESFESIDVESSSSDESEEEEEEEVQRKEEEAKQKKRSKEEKSIFLKFYDKQEEKWKDEHPGRPLPQFLRLCRRRVKENYRNGKLNVSRKKDFRYFVFLDEPNDRKFFSNDLDRWNKLRTNLIDIQMKYFPQNTKKIINMSDKVQESWFDGGYWKPRSTDRLMRAKRREMVRYGLNYTDETDKWFGASSSPPQSQVQVTDVAPTSSVIDVDLPKNQNLDMFTEESFNKLWRPEHLKAWKERQEDADNYYYYFKEVGELQRTGEWDWDEKKAFESRKMELEPKNWKPGTNWGLFSMKIPGRTGEQCAEYYQQLLKEGKVHDEAFTVVNGKVQQVLFDFQSSGALKGELASSTKKFGSKIYRAQQKKIDLWTAKKSDNSAKVPWTKRRLASRTSEPRGRKQKFKNILEELKSQIGTNSGMSWTSTHFETRNVPAARFRRKSRLPKRFIAPVARQERERPEESTSVYSRSDVDSEDDQEPESLEEESESDSEDSPLNNSPSSPKKRVPKDRSQISAKKKSKSTPSKRVISEFFDTSSTRASSGSYPSKRKSSHVAASPTSPYDNFEDLSVEPPQSPSSARSPQPPSSNNRRTLDSYFERENEATRERPFATASKATRPYQPAPKPEPRTIARPAAKTLSFPREVPVEISHVARQNFDVVQLNLSAVPSSQIVTLFERQLLSTPEDILANLEFLIRSLRQRVSSPDDKPERDRECSYFFSLLTAHLNSSVVTEGTFRLRVALFSKLRSLGNSLGPLCTAVTSESTLHILVTAHMYSLEWRTICGDFSEEHQKEFVLEMESLMNDLFELFANYPDLMKLRNSSRSGKLVLLLWRRIIYHLDERRPCGHDFSSLFNATLGKMNRVPGIASSYHIEDVTEFCWDIFFHILPLYYFNEYGVRLEKWAVFVPSNWIFIEELVQKGFQALDSNSGYFQRVVSSQRREMPFSSLNEDELKRKYFRALLERSFYLVQEWTTSDNMTQVLWKGFQSSWYLSYTSALSGKLGEKELTAKPFTCFPEFLWQERHTNQTLRSEDSEFTVLLKIIKMHLEKLAVGLSDNEQTKKLSSLWMKFDNGFNKSKGLVITKSSIANNGSLATTANLRNMLSVLLTFVVFIPIHNRSSFRSSATRLLKWEESSYDAVYVLTEGLFALLSFYQRDYGKEVQKSLKYAVERGRGVKKEMQNIWADLCKIQTFLVNRNLELDEKCRIEPKPAGAVYFTPNELALREVTRVINQSLKLSFAQLMYTGQACEYEMFNSALSIIVDPSKNFHTELRRRVFQLADLATFSVKTKGFAPVALDEYGFPIEDSDFEENPDVEPYREGLAMQLHENIFKHVSGLLTFRFAKNKRPNSRPIDEKTFYAIITALSKVVPLLIQYSDKTKTTENWLVGTYGNKSKWILSPDHSYSDAQISRQARSIPGLVYTSISAAHPSIIDVHFYEILNLWLLSMLEFADTKSLVANSNSASVQNQLLGFLIESKTGSESGLFTNLDKNSYPNLFKDVASRFEARAAVLSTLMKNMMRIIGEASNRQQAAQNLSSVFSSVDLVLKKIMNEFGNELREYSQYCSFSYRLTVEILDRCGEILMQCRAPLFANLVEELFFSPSISTHAFRKRTAVAHIPHLFQLLLTSGSSRQSLTEQILISLFQKYFESVTGKPNNEDDFDVRKAFTRGVSFLCRTSETSSYVCQRTFGHLYKYLKIDKKSACYPGLVSFAIKFLRDLIEAIGFDEVKHVVYFRDLFGQLVRIIRDETIEMRLKRDCYSFFAEYLRSSYSQTVPPCITEMLYHLCLKDIILIEGIKLRVSAEDDALAASNFSLLAPIDGSHPALVAKNEIESWSRRNLLQMKECSAEVDRVLRDILTQRQVPVIEPPTVGKYWPEHNDPEMRAVVVQKIFALLRELISSPSHGSKDLHGEIVTALPVLQEVFCKFKRESLEHEWKLFLASQPQWESLVNGSNGETGITLLEDAIN